ncbi:hypothetical protein GYMLUDRAFT_785295 [Collybiopsis luxurians FD-317 M1]|nr:hypothetical protein GYMLUDRAFT_785295 [Collybiopsis luxurians FD-317 M1]
MAVQGALPFDKFRIDPRGIAVAGSSAGGTAAYFAAMHVDPKPAAVLGIFAMGGDALIPHYYTPKTEPFISGRPLLDPSRSREYIYPFPSGASQVVSDSPLAFNPPAGPGLPPTPANPRMPLALLYLQLGTYLDYYTGQHEPSISAALRAAAATAEASASSSSDTDDFLSSSSSPPNATSESKSGSGKQHKLHTLLASGIRSVAKPKSNPKVSSHRGAKGSGSDSANPLRSVIPPQHLRLFPQFNVDASWPPTLLIHGSKDTSVPVAESKRMYELLQEAGVLSRITIVEGEEHFFDLPLGKPGEEGEAEKERKFGRVFDDAAGFLNRRIGAAREGQTGGRRSRSRSVGRRS